MIVGFLLVAGAVAIGVVIAVERTGASKNAPLTATTTQVEYTSYDPETRSSSSGVGRSTIEGANVRYRYRAEGRWFETQDPIWKPSARLADRAVCFDPDDPAAHTLRGNTDTPCGEGNHGAVRRAKAVTP
ncbi:hypothetical protein [Aeromicrobium chenweiae]|uniref:Uncharacterized protein n=1 Tax=Aeromicrobium chenweiae TaxID=2079793 RepID=A0A2S0WNL8_9ACTN|nr:hypothetical protein [Aeromicrobium chenweiae]AWB92844.1 hypothetical protein C3E78_11870 [Aeromicrobium chenweiae]TGN33838.1 hypothetical protein E4L97_01920 [Aeromicrobium chenweiae]